MDTLTITPQELQFALSTLRAGRATLFPANDGGYTFLGLPTASTPYVFSGVQWSCSATFATQIMALRKAGVEVEVGPVKT